MFSEFFKSVQLNTWAAAIFTNTSSSTFRFVRFLKWLAIRRCWYCHQQQIMFAFYRMTNGLTSIFRTPLVLSRTSWIRLQVCAKLTAMLELQTTNIWFCYYYAPNLRFFLFFFRFFNGLKSVVTIFAEATPLCLCAIVGVVALGVVTHELERVTSVRKANCYVGVANHKHPGFVIICAEPTVLSFFFRFSTD